MKKSITKNYMYNLIYQILMMILPLITTPYLSRVLGAESIGIYSYTLSITTYFILFGSLGIAMYGQREIAYVQEDETRRSKVFWEIILLRFITLGISMVIFYFSYASKGEYQIYYKILLIEIIANCFDISCFFQGMEEFKKIVTRNLIVKIIGIASIFIFIKNPNDLYKYLLIYVFSTFIGNISLWFYIPKYIKKTPLKDINILRHIKPTIILFIPQIATQIYTVLDKTMIGTMVENKAEVGYYEQSQKVVKMILTVITSLGTVMLPRIANKFANGKQEEIKESICKSFKFVYFLAIPMILGLINVANYLIPIFFGPGYEKVVIITIIISPILLMIGLSNAIGMQYLLPTKQQKKFTISVIIGALVNVTLNFILIPKFFSVGAAIGTVCAETIVTIIQLYMIRKQFNIKQLIIGSKNYIIAGIIMFIINILISKIIYVEIVRTVLQILIGILIYIVILIILKDEFIKKLMNKGYNLIKNKKNIGE